VSFLLDVTLDLKRSFAQMKVQQSLISAILLGRRNTYMSYDEYLNAKKQSDRTYRKCRYDHNDPFLPCLDSLLKDKKTEGEKHVGTLEIPLPMVIGTVTEGRRHSFTKDFMPAMDRESEFASKWARLYKSQEDEGIRDAVKVYEYMHRFYVKEGNKRVSVLKYLDVPSIMADVTRIMPEHTDEESVQCYYEFLEFFRAVPIYDIEFTRPGSYRKFAAMIGRDLQSPWPSDLINTIRGAFFRFNAVYMEIGGSRMNLCAGDAFLVYLAIYQFDSLLDYSRESIANRIHGIWNELLMEDSGRRIVLHESPDSEKKSSLRQSILQKLPTYTESHQLHAAFVYDGTIAHSEWASDHDVGRIALEHYYEGIVQTWYYENCSDDSSIYEALEDACKKGADVIFTTSASAMRQTVRAAVKHPQVRFANCSVFLPSSMVRTYNIREYEVKFLMGVLAAIYAENHKIGYLASAPAFGVLAGVNAFAIGAGMIDPSIQVYVSWSGSKENNWVEMLLKNDIRIYAGNDLDFSSGDEPDYGLIRIGDNGEKVNLASPIRNWSTYYERIAHDILDGYWDMSSKREADHACNEWWGLSAGVIDIHLSEKLSYYSRKMIDLLRNSLVKGELDPFQGELHSQNGLIQKAGSPRLSSRELIVMDWLNDNIIGEIPTYDQLNEMTQKQLEDDGVVKGKML
jgi:basic membrane lipoprotein Med (substrate-binding protein (PBP1-ABC) superfamily)